MCAKKFNYHLSNVYKWNKKIMTHFVHQMSNILWIFFLRPPKIEEISENKWLIFERGIRLICENFPCKEDPWCNSLSCLSEKLACVKSMATGKFICQSKDESIHSLAINWTFLQIQKKKSCSYKQFQLQINLKAFLDLVCMFLSQSGSCLAQVYTRGRDRLQICSLATTLTFILSYGDYK